MYIWLLIIVLISGFVFLFSSYARASKINKDGMPLNKMHAWLDKENQITLKLSDTIDELKKVKKTISIKTEDDSCIEIKNIDYVADDNLDLLKIVTQQPLSVDELYFVDLQGFDPTPVIARHVLDSDEYYYSGNDLGTVYSKENTSIRLWAPTATSVNILLYNYYNNSIEKYYQKIPMERSKNGTWLTEVNEDLNGKILFI